MLGHKRGRDDASSKKTSTPPQERMSNLPTPPLATMFDCALCQSKSKSKDHENIQTFLDKYSSRIEKSLLEVKWICREHDAKYKAFSGKLLFRPIVEPQTFITESVVKKFPFLKNAKLIKTDEDNVGLSMNIKNLTLPIIKLNQIPNAIGFEFNFYGALK